MDTVTTGKDGRAYLSLESGDYYAVETEAADGFKLDDTPIYFTVKDGETTRKTVTNKAFSGIHIHKVDPDGRGIPGVTFLLYDSGKTPSASTPATTEDMSTSTTSQRAAATTCENWRTRGMCRTQS